MNRSEIAVLLVGVNLAHACGILAAELDLLARYRELQLLHKLLQHSVANF